MYHYGRIYHGYIIRGYVVDYLLAYLQKLPNVLVFAKELWHIYAFALLFGLVWGGNGVVQNTLVANFFGPRSLGAIIGSLELLLTTGGAIGVSMAGIIFDATGSYAVPFIICIIAALLVMVFSFLLMRYKHTGVVY